MRALIVVAFLLLISSRGEAAFVSADTLRRDCNAKIGDLVDRGDVNFQRCLWYISAIHDAIQDGGVGAANGKIACFPKSLIVGDLIRPVIEFIDKLREPEKIGGGGAVILALTAAYPCNGKKVAAEPQVKYVEMNFLRANMKDYVGKAINTSGYVDCLVSMDNCTIEPELFSRGLMPYLYFDMGALTPADRALFLSKCENGCYFSGIATVELKYGHARLRPSRVTFQTAIERLNEQK